MFTKHLNQTKKKDFTYRFQRIVYIVSALLVCYCFLCCILCFSGAMQDLEKFSGLGFTKSYYSYLLDNGLWYHVVDFLLVTAEFGLYRFSDRRLARKQPVKGSKWYFSAMLILHAAAWLHANFLVQGYPPVSEVGKFVLWYRAIADTSMWPVIGYAVSYMLRFRQYSLETKA